MLSVVRFGRLMVTSSVAVYACLLHRVSMLQLFLSMRTHLSQTQDSCCHCVKNLLGKNIKEETTIVSALNAFHMWGRYLPLEPKDHPDVFFRYLTLIDTVLCLTYHRC